MTESSERGLAPERDARFQVHGTLGAGRFSPLVAEQQGPGALRRRVVLARPWPAALEAVVPHLTEAWACPEQTVHTAAGPRAVVAWRAPADLDTWWAARGAPPERAQAELREAVLRALIPLHERGLAHGDLSGATIRLQASGQVVLVQPTGGSPELDHRALSELFDLDEPSPHPHERGLVAWLGDSAPSQPVMPHALSGSLLIPERSAPVKGPSKRDPKLAAIGVFIALMSAGLAWRYAQTAPRAVEVVLDAPHTLGVECAEGTAQSELGAVSVPLGSQRCAIFVYGGDGSFGRVTLDARLPGRYRCRVVGGELECAAR